MASTQTFREISLFLSSGARWEQRWFSKRLFAMQPPDATAGPRKFYWIEATMKASDHKHLSFSLSVPTCIYFTGIKLDFGIPSITCNNRLTKCV